MVRATTPIYEGQPASVPTLSVCNGSLHQHWGRDPDCPGRGRPVSGLYNLGALTGPDQRSDLVEPLIRPFDARKSPGFVRVE